MSDDIHEECGIAAVYVKQNADAENKALFYLYRLLLNLQNRGQLSAGITTFNKNRPVILNTYRDLGSVNEVFKTSNKLKSIELFRRYAGNKGIGHVRYSTSGKDDKSYAQPFERKHGRLWKWFSFCFNGNLANYRELKMNLITQKDYHLSYDTDTEIIMHYISMELQGEKSPDLVKVFHEISKKFDGAYNIAFMNAYGDMVIARDPLGNRPLCYAERDGVLVAASESNALLNCGFDDFKRLEPGHLILIKDDKVSIKKFADVERKAHCMFEYVYFSNVSSVMNGKAVYVARTNMGKELAKIETNKVGYDHVVVPVPDTAKAAGDAYAFDIGIPSKEGLIRNRFVGRTFIESTGREDKIQSKYTALREILHDKKVLLIDDSIVRGTTTKQIVSYLKEKGGAKEVHIRVSCPPIIGPCYYGIDMSTITELLVPKYLRGLNIKFGEPLPKEILDKIAKELGADSLIYQTVEGLVRAIDLPKEELCLACLNGDYPTKWGRKLYKDSLEKFNKGTNEEKRDYQC
ncbi:MAG: amidophosphoribosyltransferase [Nanoarchaeota archaeon]